MKFSGTPTNDDVGTVQVTVTATDPSGESASQQFRFTVNNTNDTPVLVTPVDDMSVTVTSDTGKVLPLPQGVFVEPDINDALTYTLTLEDGSPLPSWLKFDEAVGITVSPATAESGVVPGTLRLAYTATDHEGARAVSVFDLDVGVISDPFPPENTAPVIGETAQNLTATEDAPFSATLPSNLFVDAENDTLTYGVSGLPEWLSFNAETMTLSGTPVNEDVGSVTLTVTATDPSGKAASQNFTFTVENTNDAPEVNPHTLPGYFVDEGELFSLPVSVDRFTDPDGDKLTLSFLDNGVALGENSWLSYDPETGILSGTPARGDSGDHWISVVATDPYGLSATIKESVYVIASPYTTMIGTPEVDTLNGDAEANHITALESNDVVYGNGGNDWLEGGAGDDILYGGKGDDLYDGGPGNDEIYEKTQNEGSDTIRFGRGDGQDYVNLRTSTVSISQRSYDTLQLKEGVAPGDVMLRRTDSSPATLQLTIKDTGDSITLYAGFSTAYNLGQITFADGTVWDYDEMVRQMVVPTDGDDVIYATNSADSIDGGLGNDAIYSLNGDDTLYGGEGNDLLYGYDGNNNLYGGNGDDTLQAEYGTNYLDGGDGNDILRGPRDTTTPRGARFTFVGGAGDDFISGGYPVYSHDKIYGGTGNDYLEGNGGNDVYYFNKGDGQDTIDNYVGASKHDHDYSVLQFGEGIAADDLWFSKESLNLKIGILGTDDLITVPDWFLFYNKGRDPLTPDEDNWIDEIQLANGETLTYDKVASLVQAMSQFSPPSAGISSLPDENRDVVTAAIAAAWE
jgi:Ca2+-binding RTX toxin-like protein